MKLASVSTTGWRAWVPPALSTPGPVLLASTAITASSATGRALLANARSLPQARFASARMPWLHQANAYPG
jgi:hypothetical protein